MKSIFKILFLISFIVFSSCSSSKSISNSERDGSSFQKAIIANSIAEEYEYARKVCQNCQLLGQALTEHKGKPYDILNFRKPNGEEISYYFDISKFFGKGF